MPHPSLVVPNAVSMVGPGWGPLRLRTRRRKGSPHRRHTPPSSYRTPIRYPPLPRRTAPRCGIHGRARVGTPSTTDPLDVRAVPTAVTPPWIPVFTGKTRWQPSFRPPSRYPPLPRLTAPRCGIHGRARVGTPSATNPLDVRAVPTAVTPPWIPVFTGKTRWQPSFRPPSRYPPSLVVPHPDAVSMVGPGWGPLRLQTRSTLAQSPRCHTTMDTRPPYPSSPTHPQPSYRPPSRYPPRSGTHPSLVLPHPDAVSMVGPGWGPLRLQTRSTSGAVPTKPVPHHRFSPVRRGGTVFPHPDPVPTPPSSYRTPMRYPWWGTGGDPFGYEPARRKGGPHRRYPTMDTGFHR